MISTYQRTQKTIKTPILNAANRTLTPRVIRVHTVDFSPEVILFLHLTLKFSSKKQTKH